VNSWLLLNSGPGESASNMALDEALLHSVAHWKKPALRFYGWTEPAATFGYFQKYSEVAETILLRPLIRRPTGGGIVPHDADWTYSLAFPPNHEWYSLKAVESYRRVHEWIRDAFARLNVISELAAESKKSAPGQCFVGHEQSDVLWRGRKIAGAAQRRTREGLLIQGSVQPPPLSLNRIDWENAMRAVAETDQRVVWESLDSAFAESLDRQAAELARTKYSQDDFNQKR
jgi:lipoate-protein ligase A